MTIIAVNAGSSSLKVAIFSAKAEQLVEASFTNISSPPVSFSISTRKSKEKLDNVHTHEDALVHFLSQLEDDKSQLGTVCHRVVHGGSFTRPVVVTEETFKQIEELSDLAPLHNASALSVIKACSTHLPKAKSIAFFDTCFHETIPKYITSYAIDPAVASEKGLRKYGFHGLSYSFIHRSVSTYLQKAPNEVSIIALHLGSGASACAIRHGKSCDTSMGLTPLDGLPGATRSGSVDPSLVFHYLKDASQESGSGGSLHLSLAEETLNKKAGWKSLTGTTDFRSIASSSDPRNKLAFDMFVDRILNYVGSYYLKLQGKVDAIVFSGGIGEHSVELREAVIKKCRCLGFWMDEGKNQDVGEQEGTVVPIGERVLVCRTDEQLEMAQYVLSGGMDGKEV